MTHPLVTAKLRIMGDITTKEPDDSECRFPCALLIEFDDPEQIRQALQDGACAFQFGDQS